MAFIESLFRNVTSLLNRLPFSKKGDIQSHVKKVETKTRLNLSPDKQAELERLCNQLFQRKELIASGKLQFIGLAKIKNRIGKKRWMGLCEIVYSTTESVIKEHLGKGDFFIRYKDDTYIIIFAFASLQESEQKANMIAEKIRQRLFQLDEKELRDLEIRKAISQIQTNRLFGSTFEDMLDIAFDEENEISFDQQDLQGNTPPPPPIKINPVEVGTESYRTRSTPPQEKKGAVPTVKCSYLPLWETQRNALTTYLCLACNDKNDSSFSYHADLYTGRSPEDKALLDLQILNIVITDVAQMIKENRKFYIVCPVQYETLHNFNTYEEYKSKLDKIPESHRAYLIFHVMNTEEDLPQKNVYWFASPLHQYCRHVFGEVPLRKDINFNYLHNTGVDVVGVRLDRGNKTSEQELISMLNNFSNRAKSLKIAKTFILDISTLSLTTSAVCAGFNYLGGIAIHEVVTKPDVVHKFRHEDLLSDLIQSQKTN